MPKEALLFLQGDSLPPQRSRGVKPFAQGHQRPQQGRRARSNGRCRPPPAPRGGAAAPSCATSGGGGSAPTWGRGAASCSSARATSPSRPPSAEPPPPPASWPPATRAKRRCPGGRWRPQTSGGCGREVRRRRGALSRPEGAEVLFSVDCTKLKDYFLPADGAFSCIYFNFPHCGRKAGVMKNRELLAQFFSRSQDKSFSVEGALNHIFTRSTPLPHLKPMICQIELGSRRVSFQVPQVLVDKINRGFLELNSEHPVRTVKEKLTAVLSQAFPIQSIDCSLPLLHQGHINGVCHPNVFWIIPNPEQNASTEQMANGLANAVLFSHVDFCKDTNENGWMKVQEGNLISEQYFLRPSLLLYVQTLIERATFLPGTLHVLSGPVFRKCPISPHSPPVFHEAVFVCAVEKGMENSCIQMLVDTIRSGIYSLHQTVSGCKLNITLQEATSFETAELNDFAAFEAQVTKIQHFLCVETDALSSCEKDCCVGTVSTARDGPKSSDLVAVFASVNLDLLAMLICGIADWRMLWTSDERFLSQFPGGELRLFKSFSLYPPSYMHDISFWVPDREQFDEVAFHTIARQVSHETVVSIQLIDSFQHSETARKSLCYRLTYQSCDKALSCQEVAEMQLLFRKEIQRCLCVTLR
ncbi:ferredoxin-fold anticodon-binding domain-containing protein 1 isoform X3 [Apteryx mantelli]|uniref:Ferredoxin-fold anticodon-binding domain-containing protein 1 isoform X3 n=1 Tax=Apteryx mantelli TaxID=2696672 RepID=A0ABM4FMM7_9AVES